MNLSLSPDDLDAIASAVVDKLAHRDVIEAKLPAERIAFPEREAATVLGVPWWTLRNARLAGEITARKLGRSYVYSRPALLAWLDGDDGRRGQR